MLTEARGDRPSEANTLTSWKTSWGPHSGALAQFSTALARNSPLYAEELGAARKLGSKELTLDYEKQPEEAGETASG